jgi:hypothetical protein
MTLMYLLMRGLRHPRKDFVMGAVGLKYLDQMNPNFIAPGSL